MRYNDRSRIVTDWTCKRKRYLNYELDGRGITKDIAPLELFLGTSVHDALATLGIWQMEGTDPDINTLASTAFKQVYDALVETPGGDPVETITFANEQASLVEGLIRGYHRHVWPMLLEMYPKVVAVEQELLYPMTDDITFMSKPDLLMEDREGNLHYIEFKTTSSKREGWINSWTSAVQVHSSIKAVEHTLGRGVADVTIIGLYKGYESYGKQNSPFCYVYQRGGHPPFDAGELSYAHKAGFKKYPVWELPGGVAAHVEAMPSHVLAEQFLITPPIMINDSLVEAFFKQTALRETEIMMAMETLKGADEKIIPIIMDGTFPQNFSECAPSYGGRTCTYRPICFGHISNPLQMGWKYREPHHTPELDHFNAVDASNKETA